MEYRTKRRVLNGAGHGHLISLPVYFLDAMDGLDVKDVILTIPDQDHILVELVRNEKDLKGVRNIQRKIRGVKQ